MQLTIPTAIAAILPLLATIISSWLADDKLTRGVNALIALAALLVAAVLCEWLAGGLIPGNPTASFIGILAYVGVLMSGDLSTLYQYLVYKPSPVAPKPANPNPVTSPVTSAAVPTPIVLPSGASVVPPRASATDTTPSA